MEIFSNIKPKQNKKDASSDITKMSLIQMINFIEYKSNLSGGKIAAGATRTHPAATSAISYIAKKKQHRPDKLRDGAPE